MDGATLGAASWLRPLLLALGALAVAASGVGITERLLFAQPSDLKYGLTVLGPLALVAVASATEPLRVVVPLLVLAAPFAGYTATLVGVGVSALVPLLVAGAAVAVVTGTVGSGLSQIGWGTLWAALLLVVPLVGGSSHAHYALLILAMIVTAWLVSRAGALPGGLPLVLTAIVGTAVLQAILALWEFRTGRQLNLYGTAGRAVFGSGYFFGFGGKPRPTGSFYDPISLGNVLALACPLALALGVASRSAAARLLAAAAGVVTTLALALSFSRMSWIGAAVGLLLTLALLPGSRRTAALAGVVGTAVVVAALALSVSQGALSDRFDSIFHPTSRTVKTAAGDRQRVQLWRAAIATAEVNPILGTGLGNLLPQLERRVGGTGPSSHAQSTYLQLLAEAGVAGALALLFVLAGIGRDLASSLRRDRILGAGLAGSVACLLVTWVTDYTVRYLAVAACVAALLGAVASQGARKVA
ncbi:MAG: putative rane protein of ExoQ family [Actinomycetia bacterium]|nr:putative rane protein of ExoQ family [Actinomycetes bacterium]